METIYRGFEGKPGLFKAAVEAASPGARSTSSDRLSHERLGPLYRTLAEAAAMEPDLESMRDELEMQRLDGRGRFAQHCWRRAALRRGMSVDEARDILWAINSHEVHRGRVLRVGVGARLLRFRKFLRRWHTARRGASRLSHPARIATRR